MIKNNDIRNIKTQTAHATSRYKHPFSGKIHEIVKICKFTQINQSIYRVQLIRNSSLQISSPVSI